VKAQFLVIYRPPRSTFGDDATAEEKRAVGDHFEYLKRLLEEGTLLLAGPCLDASMGIAVLETDSFEQAEAVLARDPAVLAGVFRGEIRPYRVSLMAGR
jgi:uncharacterized protein YciI